MSIILSLHLLPHIAIIYYFLTSSLISLFTVIYISFVLGFGLNRKKSIMSSPKVNVSKKDLTVLIPVYNEDPELFEKVVSSVRDEGLKFIVVGDGCNSPYKDIAEKYGGTFVYLKERGGKRRALREGIKYVTSPYVMFLDSDTLLQKGSVERLLMEFNDDKIAAVSPEVSVFSTKSEYASYISEMIQRLRDVSYRALSKFGSIISVNGQCTICRTDVIKPFLLSEEFNNVKLLGFKTLLGDDRQLTDYIYKRGYKVRVVSDIRVKTKGPDSLKGLIKQLLRWYRSNNFFLIKELLDGSMIKKGFISFLVLLYWYTLPLISLSDILIKGGLFFRRAYLIIVHKGFNIPLLSELIKQEIEQDIIPGYTSDPSVSHHHHVLFYIKISHYFWYKFKVFHSFMATNQYVILHLHRLLAHLMTFHSYVSIASTVASVLFLVFVLYNIENRSIKSMIVSMLAFPLMFVSDILAILTLWKQMHWGTR